MKRLLILVGILLPTMAFAQSGSISVGTKALQNLNANAVAINTAVTALNTGATPFYDASVTGLAQTMKASAGRLYALNVQNPNATAVWLQIFNNAAPTIGVTAPTLSYWIPAGGAYDLVVPTQGIAFSTAIVYAGTTTAGGAAAPASALVLNAAYK